MNHSKGSSKRCLFGVKEHPLAYVPKLTKFVLFFPDIISLFHLSSIIETLMESQLIPKSAINSCNAKQTKRRPPRLVCDSGMCILMPSDLNH